MRILPAVLGERYYSPPNYFLNWWVANLLVGFPDTYSFGFGTRIGSLPNALRLATPKKRLPEAGGGFLTRRRRGGEVMIDQ